MGKEQQYCFINGENRSVNRVKIPVKLDKYVVIEGEKIAWQRVREYCFPVGNVSPGYEFKKRLHTVFDSRWHLPISPYYHILPADVLAALVDKTEIFRGSFNSTKELNERERRRAYQGDLLGLALIIIIFGYVLFILLTSNIDLKAWGW